MWSVFVLSTNRFVIIRLGIAALFIILQQLFAVVGNFIVCKSATSVTRIFLWRSVKARCPRNKLLICQKKTDSCERGINVKEKEESILLLTLKWNVFIITAYKVVFFMRRFRFRQSATNRYQSIPIYLSIGFDNRYQSITTRIFAIDWSSIINVNRSIDIDWYRLISIVIDYRFHRLDTPGDIPDVRIKDLGCHFVLFMFQIFYEQLIRL